jgi:transposase InsO family protein
LHTELALDALEMAIWRRLLQDLTGLIHHSDRGVQYPSIRYTGRLAEAGAVCSVGSRGDSYDNALAETVNGLFKPNSFVVADRGGRSSTHDLATVLSRTGDRGVGRLAEPHTSAQRYRRRTAGRIRGYYQSTPRPTPRDSKPLSLHKTQGDSAWVWLFTGLATPS